jgi:acetyltransferase-like isoleucine patch superfamily enzyme
MTPLSQILAFFPVFILLLTTLALGWLLLAKTIAGLIGAGFAVLLSLYGVPLLAYRIHARFYPLSEGVSYLRSPTYSPWWGSHQFQVIYIAIPALETVLRLIPGLFSLWLRAWGATVGNHVYWTPGLEIADRALLTIGDRVIFGHRVGLYSHAIKPKGDDLLLYVQRITIGDEVFIGADSRFAPGVVVEADTYLPVKSDLYPKTTITPCDPSCADAN